MVIRKVAVLTTSSLKNFLEAGWKVCSGRLVPADGDPSLVWIIVLAAQDLEDLSHDGLGRVGWVDKMDPVANAESLAFEVEMLVVGLGLAADAGGEVAVRACTGIQWSVRDGGEVTTSVCLCGSCQHCLSGKRLVPRWLGLGDLVVQSLKYNCVSVKLGTDGVKPLAFSKSCNMSISKSVAFRYSPS